MLYPTYPDLGNAADPAPCEAVQTLRATFESSFVTNLACAILINTFRSGAAAAGIPAAARGEHDAATTDLVCSNDCYSTYVDYLDELATILPGCITDTQSVEAVQVQLLPYAAPSCTTSSVTGLYCDQYIYSNLLAGPHGNGVRTEDDCADIREAGCCKDRHTHHAFFCINIIDLLYTCSIFKRCSLKFEL